MARIDRSKNLDPQVKQVLNILVKYEQKHPNALIEAKRGNYDFIYLRIIDSHFHELSGLERQSEVWSILHQLPEEISRDIMMTVLVTPEEAPHSGSSIEFDDPLPEYPIPDFSEDGFGQSKNGHAMNGASANGEAILVPLEAQEVDAVKELAQSEGVSDGDLVRGWVLEKLQLASTTV